MCKVLALRGACAALVVALLLTAFAGAASHAPSAHSIYASNMNWFKQFAGSGWDPQRPVHIHTGDGVVETTMLDAARQFAERAEGVDLQQAADGVDGGSPFPMVGPFWLSEGYLGPGNPTNACNRGANDGDGGHSAWAFPNPAPVDNLDGPFYGHAISDVSQHGAGVLVDPLSGNSYRYSANIWYAGNSDFWCMDSHLGHGTWLVINFPRVDLGVATDLLPPLP